MKALRAHVLTRWQALAPREQRGLSVLGGLIGVLAFWMLAVAPALSTLQDTERHRAQIGQQQGRMLALQAQAQALQTRTVLSADEALRSLQSLTPGPQIQLSAQGDRVAVQLKNVPAAVLATWLSQARSQAHALPTEAHLTRGNTPDMWDGSLVLRLPNRGVAP